MKLSYSCIYANRIQLLMGYVILRKTESLWLRKTFIKFCDCKFCVRVNVAVKMRTKVNEDT